MAKRQKVQKLHTRSMVSVPLSVPDGKRIVRAAQQSGRPVSAFIREAALAKAAEVLGDDVSAPAAA